MVPAIARGKVKKKWAGDCCDDEPEASLGIGRHRVDGTLPLLPDLVRDHGAPRDRDRVAALHADHAAGDDDGLGGQTI